MRLFALALLLGACGEDPPPEPHDIVECDSVWGQNDYTDCEYACAVATTALNAMGPACDADGEESGPVSCQATFEHDGIQGCCATMKPRVLFAECTE